MIAYMSHETPAERKQVREFARKHAWDTVRRNVNEAYGRASAQLDWAIWSAEEDLERTIAGPVR